MTDIEAKALALVREVLAERNLSDKRAVRREVSPYTEVLCRAIEQHEALTAENERLNKSAECLAESRRLAVKDLAALEGHMRLEIGQWRVDYDCAISDIEHLRERIEAQAAEIERLREECQAQYDRGYYDGRAALEARGLEIREKGQ